MNTHYKRRDTGRYLKKARAHATATTHKKGKTSFLEAESFCKAEPHEKSLIVLK